MQELGSFCILLNSKQYKIARQLPPEGWRIISRDLLLWADPCWGEKKSSLDSQLFAPKGIFKEVENKRSSEFSYFAARTTLPDSDVAQKLFSVFDMRVLSELFHLFLIRNKRSNDLLIVRPSEIINGLGMALSGSSYNKVEKSLADLASFRVESKPSHIIGTDFLLSSIDTGCIAIDNGKVSKASKRHEFWRISLGKLLCKLLSNASLFTSFSATAYKESGRSPVAQWLCMFFSSHGHNGSLIFDHKLTTLAEKSNLYQQQLLKHEQLLQKYAEKKGLDKYDVEGKREELQKSTLKTCSARISKGIKKLSVMGIFREIFVSDANDGQVHVTRYPTSIEIFLSRQKTAARKTITNTHNYLNKLVQYWNFAKGLQRQLKAKVPLKFVLVDTRTAISNLLRPSQLRPV